MTELKTVTPEQAAEMINTGAVLIDIREADEHAREHIPGARLHALSRIDSGNPAMPGDDVVIFHCRSGARTQSNAPRLAGAAPDCEAFILQGGIDAWKKAGLPTAIDRRQPIELMRQVQIAVGGLVLMGVLLGIFVSPLFYVLPAFAGLGLLLAGITGFCGMARLLRVMPWNQHGAAPSAAR